MGIKWIFAGCLLSWSALAADIPQDDIANQQFDKMKCISDNSQTCINDVCLNSEALDCQDNCQKVAVERCKQESNE